MPGTLKVGGNIIASHTGVEGAGTVTLGNVVLGDSAVPTNNSTFRNKIINGDMRIAQRGTSFSTNNGRNFGVDRFACNASANTTITFSQSTDAPSGFTNSLLATVSNANSSATAADTNYILQVIEGYNIADLNFGTLSAKNFTFSFYVKSSLTGSFSVGFASNNNDRVYHTNYTINSANTWEHKTIQVSGPTSGTWLTDNGVGLMPLWDLGFGTDFESNTTNVWDSNAVFRRSTDVNLSLNAGATLQITGVQLEEGTIATPFEHRPLAMELGLCQRYFFKGNTSVGPEYLTNGGNIPFTSRTTFPVTMNHTPDMTNLGFTSINNSHQPGFLDITADGFGFTVQMAAGVGAGTVRSTIVYSADAEL